MPVLRLTGRGVNLRHGDSPIGPGLLDDPFDTIIDVFGFL